MSLRPFNQETGERIVRDPRIEVYNLASSATVTTYTWDLQYKSLHLTTTNGNALTVTLPKMAEAVGQRLFAYAESIDSGDAVTFTDAGDDADFDDVTMDTDDDAFIFETDGMRWFVTAASATT